MNLKPFFTYFGGKWRSAPRYPAPAYPFIVEPFAGSAGYALRYADRLVLLNEKDPRLAALWRYLISVSAQEIMGLPTAIEEGATVDTLPVCQEARDLIGFWLNKGTTTPRKTPSAWMRGGLRPKSYWGVEIRARIARQVEHIRHWRVTEHSYADVPPHVATWFVDPPYIAAGHRYAFGSTPIDYAHLAQWCKNRFGQVIVCEAEGATWLPFQPFLTIKSTEGRHVRGVSHEVIWTGYDLRLPKPGC